MHMYVRTYSLCIPRTCAPIFCVCVCVRAHVSPHAASTCCMFITYTHMCVCMYGDVHWCMSVSGMSPCTVSAHICIHSQVHDTHTHTHSASASARTHTHTDVKTHTTHMHAHVRVYACMWYVCIHSCTASLSGAVYEEKGIRQDGGCNQIIPTGR